MPSQHAAINFLTFDACRLQDGAYQEFQAGEGNKATEDRGASVKPPRLDNPDTDPTVGGRYPVVSVGMHPGGGLDSDLMVGSAIADVRVGALPLRINQSWAKVSEEYEQLALVLKERAGLVVGVSSRRSSGLHTGRHVGWRPHRPICGPTAVSSRR